MRISFLGPIGRERPVGGNAGLVALLFLGCSGSYNSGTPSGNTGVGGATEIGGSSAVIGATGGSQAGVTNPSGGAVATGGKGSGAGGALTGGAPPAMGGAESTGGSQSAAGGGNPTGGARPTGGANATGGSKATGGSSATATGGASAVGGASGVTGPCDIYAAASPATPCAAAYSMTRIMYSKYSGPLYQVRKGGTWSASTGMSGGTFQDIGTVAGGYADTATQDTFCGTGTCTVSTIYDQSGKGNNLKVAPKGCYTGTASEPDSESSATKKSTTLNGHKVYALYMLAHDGYRNNTCTGVPTGNNDNGIYIVADGTHAGSACCWDFGNVWPDNCNSHTMNTIFFGTGYWGTGAGAGPWFLGDFEGGVWSGGSGASNTNNPNNPSMKIPFAFGILKTSSGKYAIRAADATSGALTTAYDGASPKSWTNGGNIVLGTGGDNSNSSFGTFYEGADTAGRPSDATDALVLQNVQAAGYGK